MPKGLSDLELDPERGDEVVETRIAIATEHPVGARSVVNGDPVHTARPLPGPGAFRASERVQVRDRGACGR
jgi:hypothetical protein